MQRRTKAARTSNGTYGRSRHSHAELDDAGEALEELREILAALWAAGPFPASNQALVGPVWNCFSGSVH